VESVKSVSDVYAPVSCEVIESNAALKSDPTLLNKDPENKGWIAKVKLTKLDEFESLLDPAAYKAHCEAEHAAHH
jgi:glycine cleavage system H protein